MQSEGGVTQEFHSQREVVAEGQDAVGVLGAAADDGLGALLPGVVEDAVVAVGVGLVAAHVHLLPAVHVHVGGGQLQLHWGHTQGRGGAG